jgi:hypothetical protein
VARLVPACALMTEANFCPFWSSEIFVAAEVLPLKKLVQLVLISPVVLADPPVEGEDAPDAAALVAGGLEFVLPPELLQAAVTKIRPRTGTNRKRDRIGAPPQRDQSQELC